MEEEPKKEKERKEKIIIKKTSDLLKLKLDRLMANPVRNTLYTNIQTSKDLTSLEQFYKMSQSVYETQSNYDYPAMD